MTVAVRYDFIRALAQHRPIAPDLVFRRLKFIGVVCAVSLLGAIALMVLFGLDTSLSEPARLLVVIGLVAAIILMLSGLISAGLLLWGGFITQYVAALDAKEQTAEVLLRGDSGVLAVTEDSLTIANELLRDKLIG